MRLYVGIDCLSRFLGVTLGAWLLLMPLCGMSGAGTGDGVVAPRATGDDHAIVIQGATILDGTGRVWRNASLHIKSGKIVRVGERLPVPDGVVVLRAEGKWLTPGIIDVHSHLGSHSVGTSSDAHELTGPNTADVRMENSVWPQDPGFDRALRAGVTTVQVMPGSANVFNGQSVVVRTVRARTVAEMKLAGAPHGLKMAFGEGPKFIYSARGEAPATRMGSVAIARAAWRDAQRYVRERGRGSSRWMDFQTGSHLLKLETLADALDGRTRVHVHCYRADDIATQLDLAREQGYAVAGIHHASEAYKIADLLARERTCVAVWADWWGFRAEAHDGIPENAALLEAAGACVALHSDSVKGVQYLNHAAARAYHAGRHAGLLEMPEAEAWKWISLNPARMLGIDRITGSIEPGKLADFVLWNAPPMSVYARVDQVYVEGVLQYDRAEAQPRGVRDFELGHPGEGDRK